MKCLVITLFFLLFSEGLFAQYENVWIFGDSAGIDFSSGRPKAIRSSISGFGEAAASICDDKGSLLFYTEGSIVWDRNGRVMPNGHNLTPLQYDSRGFPTSSSSQGTMIMPVPGSDSRYYVFSMTCQELYKNPQNDSLGRLYYSIVDMNLNRGLGDVESGTKGVLIDTHLTEHMAGALGTHCNMWVITCSRNTGGSSQFKAFEITENGINATPVISLFPGITGDPNVGQICLSPDFRKMALTRVVTYTRSNGTRFILSLPVALYEFDGNSGHFSNEMLLGNTNIDNVTSYGVCFSPDGSKLYYVQGPFPRRYAVYQYDLSSGDRDQIMKSHVFIDSAALTSLKRGPDGKMYYLSDNNTKDSTQLGAIHYPDLAGKNCTPEHNVIKVAGRAYSGLPHNVTKFRQDTSYSTNYREGACFAKEIILSARYAEGWDYNWNNGSQTQAIQVDTPGMYWVSYFTRSCTRHIDTFWVSFPDGVLPDFAIEASCINDNNGSIMAYTYPGDNATYSYTWTDQNDRYLSAVRILQNISPGYYKVRIRTAGCDTTLAVLVPAEDHKVGFRADTLICEDVPLLFRNNSDRYFNDFTWYLGQKDTSSSRDVIHNFPGAGQYSVFLVGKGERCVDTASTLITVDASVKEVELRKDKTAICAGEAIAFSCTRYPTHTGLMWSMGDGSDIRDDDYILHAYDRPGKMPVQLRSQFRACPDILVSDTVMVYPIPHVDLGPDTVLCFGHKEVILHNIADDLPGQYQYLWKPGNDTGRSLAVKEPGIYSVEVRSAYGCYNTQTISIKKDCYLDIPSAFSPNGDGQNDYFFPRTVKARDIHRFKMRIVDRWGQLMFVANGADGRGWDGRCANLDQPAGVYVYQVDIWLGNGRQESYSGNVTLLR